MRVHFLIQCLRPTRTAIISRTFKHSDNTLTHTDKAPIWMNETATADSSKNFQNIVDFLFPEQKKSLITDQAWVGYCGVFDLCVLKGVDTSRIEFYDDLNFF